MENENYLRHLKTLKYCCYGNGKKVDFVNLTREINFHQKVEDELLMTSMQNF